MEIMFESNDLSRREEAALCSKPSKKKVRIRLEQRIQRLHVKNTVFSSERQGVFSTVCKNKFESDLEQKMGVKWPNGKGGSML